MPKFHVNAEGNVGECKAQVNCPFGDLADDHYNSKDEARSAFERTQQAFSAPNPVGTAISNLPQAFDAFLSTHSSVHKAAQGDEFEAFFEQHLLKNGVQVFDLQNLPPEAEEKVKQSLKNLKALTLTDSKLAKNELGEAYFIRHPNGVNQFPDYVVATPKHIVNFELKSGKNFTYIMLGAHTPKVTDVFLLADFVAKKEMTMLFIGDHVKPELLQQYDDLRKDAEAISAKGKAIGGGLKVDSGISFRTEGIGPFKHEAKEKRQKKVMDIFNQKDN